MKQQSTRHTQQSQLFWPKVVMRKWLNISAKESDYSADTDTDDSDPEGQADEPSTSNPQSQFCEWGRGPRFRNGQKGDEVDNDFADAFPGMRRRKSETFRTQYINTQEIKVCVGTWNVGGKLPTDDLDIDSWLGIGEPADMYVIGLQEIIPLNAGNIFGPEDYRPVQKWENIIRETLNRMRPSKPKFKCYSEPPSPTRFKPSEDAPDVDELMLESDSDGEEEIHPLNEEFDGFNEVRDESSAGEITFVNSEASVSSDDASLGIPVHQDLERQFSSPKRLDRLNCLGTEDCTENEEVTVSQTRKFVRLDRLNCLRTEDCTENEEVTVSQTRKFVKTLSGTERIGLSWPEPPLDLLGKHVLNRPNSFKSVKSFKSSKSFGAYHSFKLPRPGENSLQSEAALVEELDLESNMDRKRRTPYVRIVSKQMVGVFLTIWVRRSLRRHIQNLKVSTVGVGVMGYIGNKVKKMRMQLKETLMCMTYFEGLNFILFLLLDFPEASVTMTRGKEFKILECYSVRISLHWLPVSTSARFEWETLDMSSILPWLLTDWRIIWLGDLNYRINLSYEKTRELISRKDWSKLVESDQLSRELRKGRAFDGWCEGSLNFPPTYKYELNSEKYCGEDPKVGRRTPGWCDRILSLGKGMRLLSYGRTELRLSDHRPVTASYVVEVEVFSPRKLQRALTFTDAEIENQEGLEVGYLRSREDVAYRER
ncbi:hypothetical protein RHGRI_031877 [Rhododendron griersonianum]|uniref:Inositol polyphosphate-related phosphatase domain-containing protein n=1 Tax=Rhododendron griersonianum TaxID=479676 RepID=A0AAV6ID13_9ERIC|nr:hypothetical protein RHGRI_031877 [Rhododendron griersonianum]